MEPSALVPNARRVGFEDDAAWKKVRTELAKVVKELGKEAYAVSKQGQLSVEAQKKNLKEVKKELKYLQRTDFAEVDRAIKLSTNITTYQTRIAQGVLGADMEAAAELQAIGSALSDIKLEALSHVGAAAAAINREAYRKMHAEGLPFVPLYVDLALAVAHHLIIGRNIPLERAVEWIIARGKWGLIEFVPKQDPTAQTMLELREDVFPA